VIGCRECRDCLPRAGGVDYPSRIPVQRNSPMSAIASWITVLLTPRGLFPFACALVLAVLPACSRNTAPPESVANPSHALASRSDATRSDYPWLGVWEFEAGRYDPAAEFSPANPARGKLKYIGESRFMWVEYDRQSGAIQHAAGGRCEVEGTNLVEIIEFFGPEMESLMGQRISFVEQVKEGRLYHQSKATNGLWIDEIWRRPARADNSSPAVRGSTDLPGTAP